MKSLWYKIGLGYFLLVCISIGICVVAVYNFSRLNDFISTIVHNNYRGVLASENMVKTLERQEIAHFSMIYDDIDSAYTLFNINVSGFWGWQQEVLQLSTDPSETALLKSIGNAYDDYVSLTDSLYNILQRPNGRRRGVEFTSTALRPISNGLKQQCFRLLEINGTALTNTETRIKSTITDATYTVVVASIFAVVLSILASVRITRAVRTPAETLTRSVRNISQGQLNQKIDVTTDDEFGELATEFNKMTERLRHYEELNIHQLVSEKKKSETIVESIADPLIVADNSGLVVLMNKAAAHMLDVDPASVAGKSLGAVVRDDRWAQILGTVQREQPDNLQREILLKIDRKGKSLYFRPRQTTIVDERGNVSGIITLMQDVTRFKDLDEIKTEFLATVSHEFRTPLTSINMTVDLLSREVVGKINPRQKELLVAAKDDCDRLGKLVRDLLDLSKLESGKQEMKVEDVSVRELLEESLKPLRLPFEEKHILLQTDVAEDVRTVQGDRHQLSWVITNLASNALRFTPERGSVRITAQRQPGELRLAVSDSGPGIPPESRTSIFDKFVQIKESAETTPGSVGLGLAIAREVVEAHSGRIWVDSVEGKGSTFYVTIPLKR
ncbi:MAG TPA: ATP-binding protein [Bacteroidota bacterium]|nr:ATP-binding protein [Bacteroidota bacterium]